MSWDTVLRGIDAVLHSDAGRCGKAIRIAELIRQAGGYRWVGLYEVTDREIAVLGWSGPGAPASPRFPATQGLSGAAVATRRAVVVNDMTADPRYMTAFAARGRRPSFRCWIPARVWWLERWMWRAPSGTPSPTPTAKHSSASLPLAAGCSPSS